MKTGLITLMVGLCILGEAQAQEGGYVPRSSNPGGFRVDDATLAAGPDSMGAGLGSATGAPRPGAAALSSSGGTTGSVQIQGNTSVNATGRNVDSTAVGRHNRGCTRVGGIGEC